MTKTLIHLVRHAEVENPDNIWYGRLEGWVLSERGIRQTLALGEHFADKQLSAIYSSPLTRAIQTSDAIAVPHGIEVQISEEILESEAKLQGLPGDRRLFRNPANLRYFLNPMKPSWGEPYVSIRARMREAITGMRTDHAGGEVVVVSHQTPVLVARLMFEGNPKPPWRAKVPCERASVTTLIFDGDTFAGTEYLDVGTAVT